MVKSRTEQLCGWTFAVILLASALASCGGDGNDDTCAATPGVYPTTYEPGVSNGAGYSRLSYTKGVDQSWQLTFHGTTDACSAGLEVRAVSTLPSGYSLSTTTGTITRSSSATGQSGFCVQAGQVMGEWSEGLCPAGQTPLANGYEIEVRSSTQSPFRLGVTFEPAR